MGSSRQRSVLQSMINHTLVADAAIKAAKVMLHENQWIDYDHGEVQTHIAIIEDSLDDMYGDLRATGFELDLGDVAENRLVDDMESIDYDDD